MCIDGNSYSQSIISLVHLTHVCVYICVCVFVDISCLCESCTSVCMRVLCVRELRCCHTYVKHYWRINILDTMFPKTRYAEYNCVCWCVFVIRLCTCVCSSIPVRIIAWARATAFRPRYSTQLYTFTTHLVVISYTWMLEALAAVGLPVCRRNQHKWSECELCRCREPHCGGVCVHTVMSRSQDYNLKRNLNLA